MVKKHLRYVVEQKDRYGNVRLYFWKRPGPRIRLHGIFGSEEFMRQYGRCLAEATGAIPAHPAHAVRRGSILPGSLRALCVEYFSSARFRTELDDGTQSVRRRIIEQMLQEPVRPEADLTFADVPVSKITPRAIFVLRDRKAETPEAANARVKALRQVFAWAIEMGEAQGNPARDVPYLSGNKDGFHTWTIEEVKQFQKHHPLGTKAHLALSLLLFTGVRRGDVVRLGRQMIRRTPQPWLHFTEEKGSRRNTKHREIPALPELMASIEAAEGSNLTFLVTQFGKPFSANGFGNWFRKRCNEAGLPHCTAHGLRKAGATIAADNGATEHQLMAIYGWESPKQAAIYTRKANRKKLVGEAMHLIVPQASGSTDEEQHVITSGGDLGPVITSGRKAQ